jgi:hypothetical protein
MRTIRIIVPTDKGEEECRVLVRACGGKWIDEVGPGYGVVTRGDQAAYLSFSRVSSSSLEMYSAEEIADLRKILHGLEPKTIVSIDIGHQPASEQLAREMATRVATEWKGVQDWREAE